MCRWRHERSGPRPFEQRGLHEAHLFQIRTDLQAVYARITGSRKPGTTRQYPGQTNVSPGTGSAAALASPARLSTPGTTILATGCERWMSRHELTGMVDTIRSRGDIRIGIETGPEVTA